MNYIGDLYIVIDHINGEIEDIFLIRGCDFAKHCSEKLGYIVFSINLDNLEVSEL